MDFKNQDFNVLSMPEAVTKVSLGKPVYVLTQLYPETPLRVLASALGFVESENARRRRPSWSSPRSSPRRGKSRDQKRRSCPSRRRRRPASRSTFRRSRPAIMPTLRGRSTGSPTRWASLATMSSASSWTSKYIEATDSRSVPVFVPEGNEGGTGNTKAGHKGRPTFQGDNDLEIKTPIL